MGIVPDATVSIIFARISIVAVIWFKNKGLAIVLLVILPFLFVFTRIIQKNMLAAQIENRRAVGRASGHVPETLHNIRTIHALDKDTEREVFEHNIVWVLYFFNA